MADNKGPSEGTAENTTSNLPEKQDISIANTLKSSGKNVHKDVGAHYFELSLQHDPAELERDSVKVRRKLDLIVLPMVGIHEPNKEAPQD